MRVKKGRFIIIAGMFVLVFGISSAVNALWAQSIKNKIGSKLSTTGGGVLITPPLGGGYVPDYEAAPSADVNPGVNSWSQKIPGGERFELVLDGQAVLDNETDLVWTQNAGRYQDTWEWANDECISHEDAGGRFGWHLPTVSQLASLVDETQLNPKLPAGHPFTYEYGDIFWTSTTAPHSAHLLNAYVVNFSTGIVRKTWKGNRYHMWCVRGGTATEF